MFGTLTASEISARKVKLFSHLISSRYFPRWRKVVAKVQFTRKNLFSQTNFAFAFKLSNYCAVRVRVCVRCAVRALCTVMFIQKELEL